MSSSVDYILTDGTLNINPSSKVLQLSKNAEGVSEGTLFATTGSFVNSISTPEINIGNAHSVRNGVMTGTYRLGETGASIDSTANKITGLATLDATLLTSGLISIDSNNISGVSTLTVNSIASNNFTVQSTTADAVTTSTISGDMMKLGKGANISIFRDTTLTGLTTLDVSSAGVISSGNIRMTGNTLSGASEVTAVTFTDGVSTGSTTISGGIITATEGTFVTGGISTLTTSTMTVSTKATIDEFSDNVLTIKGGTISDVTKLAGTTIEVTRGTLGGSTFTGTGTITGVTSLDAELITCGGSTFKTMGGTVSVTGVGSINASTITDGTIALNEGNITGIVNLTASRSVITTGTIGGSTMTGGNITGVASLNASIIQCGPSIIRRVINGESTMAELTNITTVSASTLTDGMVSITGGVMSNVANISGSAATLTSASITSLISGSTTLSSNNLSGLGSASMSSATIGTDIKFDGSLKTATGFSNISSTMVSSGATTLTSNTLSGLTKLNFVADGGELNIKNVSVSSDNVTGVSSLSVKNVSVSTLLKAEGFESNKFTVVHDPVTTKTTARSDVFTDGSITIASANISGVVSIAASTLTSGATTLMSNTLSGLTSLTSGAMSTGQLSLTDYGNISGVGTMTTQVINTTSTTVGSTINGDLTIRGDLKVVNQSAKVIELQHEQMSTKDPILEFNEGLGSSDDPANTSGLTNASFGFVSVMKNSENKKTAAGLVANVVSDTDVEFTLFNSSGYPSSDSNDYVSASNSTYSLSKLRCNNITSDGHLVMNHVSNSYIAIGDVSGRASEKIFTSGDVKGANFTVTGSITNTGSDSFVVVGPTAVRSNGERIVSDGKIKTLTLETTNFTQTSDIRKKENVMTIEDAVSNIERLRPVTFDWKSDGTSDVGFIAQELRDVYPDLVKEDGEGFLSVAYTGLVAPLVKAVQQQQAMIKALEERLAKLEK